MDLLEFDKDIDSAIKELKSNIKTHEIMIKDSEKIAAEYKKYSERFRNIIELGDKRLLTMREQENEALNIKCKIEEEFKELKVNINECNISVKGLVEKSEELKQLESLYKSISREYDNSSNVIKSNLENLERVKLDYKKSSYINLIISILAIIIAIVSIFI